MANETANARVKAEMAKFGINQKELAEILEMNESALSIMLGVELGREVQKHMIDSIRSHKAS